MEPPLKLRIAHPPGPCFNAGGKEYLYFAGTAYLGVQHLGEFRELMARNTHDLGTHWGASRTGAVEPEIYTRSESVLADWAGSEAAITVSSGFLAGRLLSDAFSVPGYKCIYSPCCHAALMPPGAERARDWEDLKERLLQAQAAHPLQKLVLFTDSLDFRRGPESVAGALESLPVRNLMLVADDSHAVGLLGANGAGLYRQLASLGFEELLVCGSLGKAMGITAGLVLGQRTRLRMLCDSPLFSGASPAPPAGLATLCNALDSGLYDKQRLRLVELLDYFNTLLEQMGGEPGQAVVRGAVPILQCGRRDHPVTVFHDPALAAALLEQQILVTHFHYPAEGNAVSPGRIVLGAAHTKEQASHLADRIAKFSIN